ncbi:MAG: ABC transporter permease [Methylococcales bacterium]|nr:ABC transporter permease [Methylococcales bacterium]
MNSLTSKIRADLVKTPGRSLSVMLSIAAGLFCLGTVFGMIDSLLVQMDLSQRASQPAHINVMLRGDGDATLYQAIHAETDVAAIETVTPLPIRYQDAQQHWRNALLVVRTAPALQSMSKITPIEGAWPGSRQLAVERQSAMAFGLSPGTVLHFKHQQRLFQWPVVGVMRHPFVQPPRFGGLAHFFADPHSAHELGLAPASFRQLLITLTPPYQAERAHQLAVRVRQLCAEHNVMVGALLVQDPERHWGRPFLAGINQVLQHIGLASLLLSCMLIANSLAAHLAQERRQIGIIKALGGGVATLMGVYLAETLLLALGGLLLALPAALFSADALARQLLDWFNINATEFLFSSKAVAVMLAGSVLAPLAVAALPVWRGVRQSVRTALSDLPEPGHMRLQAALERLAARFLPTLEAAALGNMLRQTGRLAITQGVLISAGVMLMVLLALAASIDLTLQHDHQRRAYNIHLALAQAQPEQPLLNLLQQLPGVQQARSWQHWPLQANAGDGQPLRQQGSLGLQLVGVPVAASGFQPALVQGRWLGPGDAGRRVLVLNAETAALNHIQLGDSVPLPVGQQTALWQVVGLYRWLVGTGFSVEPVYAPLSTLRHSPGIKRRADTILLNAALTTPEAEQAFLEQAQNWLTEHGIAVNVFATHGRLQHQRELHQQFQPLLLTLFGLAALIASVAGIGLSGALTLGVLQRTREIGVLRAIGAPSGSIFRLFWLEGLWQGVLAWLLSVPLAFVLARPAAEQLGQTVLGVELDFAFNPLAPWYWLGLVLLVASLAAYGPARQATHLTIQRCLGR